MSQVPASQALQALDASAHDGRAPTRPAKSPSRWTTVLDYELHREVKKRRENYRRENLSSSFYGNRSYRVYHKMWHCEGAYNPGRTLDLGVDYVINSNSPPHTDLLLIPIISHNLLNVSLGRALVNMSARLLDELM